MSTILYLTQRNRGNTAKPRSFRLVRALAAKHCLLMGCLVDTTEDEGYIQEARRYCDELFVLRRPFSEQVFQAMKLSRFSKEPLINVQLAEWIQQVCGQYSVTHALALDPLIQPYLKYVSLFDKGVSFNEQLNLTAPGQNYHVDTDYYDPKATYLSPYPQDTRVLLVALNDEHQSHEITGFIRYTWPQIKQTVVNAKLVILTPRSIAQLNAFHGQDITVGVKPKDWRPFLQYAAGLIAFDSASLDDVLAAMSMNCQPIIGSVLAERLACQEIPAIAVCQHEQDWLKKCLRALLYPSLSAHNHEYTVRLVQPSLLKLPREMSA